MLKVMFEISRKSACHFIIFCAIDIILMENLPDKISVSDTSMKILFNDLLIEDVEIYVLILSSSGIAHYTNRVHGSWELWVDASKFEYASDTIEKYLLENRGNHQAAKNHEPVYHKNFSGIWAGIILLIFHVAITKGWNSRMVIQEYGSSAHHILHGELYRCVTSLMIHSDALHIISNMAGIALFGSAVCSIMGLGVGWFMILTAGIAGNLLNAVFYESSHLSIGASTAIFGAIGIITGCQSIKKMLAGQRIKALLPFGGGVALLGILGSSPHSDLMAHLFGFLSGTVFGGVYGMLVKKSSGKNIQAGFFVATIFIIVISWLHPS